MGKPRVVLDHSGMRALLNDPGVRAELEARAARVADQARATAPVDTGEYRDSIAVWADVTDRVVVRVGSRDRKAPIVEAKTGNMARALDAAGGE